MQELTKCNNCNKEFHTTKEALKRNNNNYCSKECYYEFQKAKEKTIVCNGCGKEFIRPLWVKDGKTNFCSIECRTKKDRVLTCKVCGVEFCSILYGKSKKENCYVLRRPIRKTCSNECTIKMYKTDKVRKEKISIAFSGEKHPNYVNGCSKNGRVRKTDKKENMSLRQKREIFLKFSNKCFKCGSHEDLTLDHHLPFCMDGRLTESNSVVLCRSCNSSKNAKHPTRFYTQKELMALNKIGVSHNNLFNFIF